MVNGLLGAIVIKPRPDRPNPFALIGNGLFVHVLKEAEANSATLMVEDWSHIPLRSLWSFYGFPFKLVLRPCLWAV